MSTAPPTLHVGDIRLTLFDGGRLRLDGGAMFGIIPKPLWQRLAPPDDRNRIRIGCTCVMAESGGRRILIDTGVGNKYSEKDRDIFEISQHWIADAMQAAGVDPVSIDTVILTHLHFDHAGGATRMGADQRPTPTFPRATYLVQRGEWEDAIGGYYVMTATYRDENLRPLAESGRLVLLDGEAEVAPGMRVRPLPGHTRHQQGVLIYDRGRTAVQPGDLMPTSAHVGLRYNMGYDLLPYDNMVNKRRLLEEAAAGNWTLLLGQDPDHTAYTVQRESEERFTLARV